jgi:rSAM/selenodomain-associated transferase 2
MPLISIVVPVLDDTVAVERLLGHLPTRSDVEMLVIDGGYDVRLNRLAEERPDVRLMRAPAGRATQMNAGAAAATGRWLWFLHADSAPADGSCEAIAATPPTAVGGWFRFALDSTAWQARLLERAVAWRVRALRLPYGDQGVFVRADVFAALGGYRTMPLMEDVELVRRLVMAGPVREVPLRLVTSSRRWQRDGWLRRSAMNMTLLALYFAGVSPTRLARWY